MNDRDTKTYILLTKKGEYYCGKTIDIKKRMDEHKKYVKGEWFSMNERHIFELLMVIPGDYEKNIKSFGVKKFWECFNKLNEASLS